MLPGLPVEPEPHHVLFVVTPFMDMDIVARDQPHRKKQGRALVRSFP
jgi:hypothetical protein